MAIIKCKMCGGDIVLNEEKTIGTCEYCGTQMTLPKVSDEQRAARFNRGNHFRRQGEFDKALGVYESIVREDDTDAEAHWCCALCRFGIEYVEDPNTYEYLPTCHRASFDSFLEDVDYLAALEHSDGITRRQYQKDAAKIAEVQRGILATSQNEEPFDVFICYKETDDQTKERTRDSLDAQEIYYQLTQEGYRVFFSRITLEDKAGTEYEPYIFAALNSAKVMVAIGSKPEYFNAVWVKNEWSRFLAMMRKDRSKLLLPCYKGMDPYDLPEQLGVLQSYDMSKIGFMQDLIRGIKKVLFASESRAILQHETTDSQKSSFGPSLTALIRRGYLTLEDGDYGLAKTYFDQALNMNAENAEAYLGLAYAEANVNSLDALVRALFSKQINTQYPCEIVMEADEAHIQEMISRYAVDQFLPSEKIRALYCYHLTFPSDDQLLKQQKTAALKAFDNNRMLSRAKMFSSDQLRKQIDDARNTLSTLFDAKAEAAAKKDEAQQIKLLSDYRAFLDHTDQDLSAKSSLAAVRKETEDRIRELEQLYAMKQAEQTLPDTGTAELALRQEELQQLLKEQHELGLFNASRKKALQKQIEQKTREISNIEANNKYQRSQAQSVSLAELGAIKIQLQQLVVKRMRLAQEAGDSNQNDESIVIIKKGPERIVCPKCGEFQRSNRTVCQKCGVLFVFE